MATLQDAIDEIQARLADVTGIRYAPEFAPDAVNAFPAAIAYPRSGAWNSNDATFKTGLHTIIVEVHVERHDLARAIEQAMQFSDSVPNAIMAGLTSGDYEAIQTYEEVRYEAGPMKWNDVDTWGFRFFIDGVKMQSPIT